MIAKKTEADPIVGALESLGLPRDVAESMLAEAKAANPGLTSVDLVPTIADMLRARGPETKPVKQRRPRKTIVPLEPGDLRAIVAAGREAGLSGYEALLEAGIIKSPLKDFPL